VAEYGRNAGGDKPAPVERKNFASPAHEFFLIVRAGFASIIRPAAAERSAAAYAA
jgi:hypothetical protein